MGRGRLVATFVWKEVVDLVRDRATLAMAILLPLILLPLTAATAMGLRGQQEAPKIYIEVEERHHYTIICPGTVLSMGTVLKMLEEGAISRGLSIASSPSDADLWIRIAPGFLPNVSSFERQALIYIELVPGSSRAQQAFDTVMQVIGEISNRVSEMKVRCLGNYSRDALCTPILVVYSYRVPGVGTVPFEEAARYSLARLLVFSLMFVLSPVTLYLVDSIVGEKERRTLEALMALPIAKHSFVLGKVVSSSVVGLVAAGSDAAGLILYFNILSGGAVRLDPLLVVMHGIAIYVTVLLSLSIALPVVLRSPSYRSANMASLGIIGAASAIYMAALFVDLHALKGPAALAIHLDPFTYTALFIHYAVFGNYTLAAAYIATAAAVSVALITVSAYMVDYEKLVYTVRE